MRKKRAEGQRRLAQPRYDHRTRAGNQGDVVKHVALMAAGRHALEGAGHRLKYVDAFAGPGGSLLLPGGRWMQDIGEVNRAAKASSPDVARWLRWYLSRPQLVGSRYPGSALIMADLAMSCGKPISMNLWDVSAEAVEDLRHLFPKQRVHHGPVNPTAAAVRDADLLLIDPPGVGSSRNWRLLLELIKRGQHMLAWLPVTANNRGSVSKRSETQLHDVLLLEDTAATRVLWPRGGRTMGCHLVYRCSDEAICSIRAAVEEVVSLSTGRQWEVQHWPQERAS